MMYKRKLVMSSHEEYQTMAEITIGYDALENLVIRLCVYDEGDSYPTGVIFTARDETKAIIDKDEIRSMACRLDIPPSAIMNHLYDGFKVRGYISSTSYVTASFSNMLNYILDQGAKYRLRYASYKRRAA